MNQGDGRNYETAPPLLCDDSETETIGVNLSRNITTIVVTNMISMVLGVGFGFLIYKRTSAADSTAAV